MEIIVCGGWLKEAERLLDYEPPVPLSDVLGFLKQDIYDHERGTSYDQSGKFVIDSEASLTQGRIVVRPA